MGTITIKNLIGGSINIITTGGGNTPPAGAERWVEPVYTDEWVWSDGEQHGFGYYDENWEFIFNWTNENMPTDNVQITIDGDSILSQESEYPNNFRPIPYSEFKTTTKVKVNLTDDLVLTGYRKFTPGHWEDADGNWINGSWGEWSDLNFNLKVFWANSGDENPSNPDQPFDADGWRFTTIYEPVSTNINENLINGQMFGIATRTWNNTKPAPAA